MDNWTKVEMAKTMQPYDPNRTCPKCLGAEVRSNYDAGHECGDQACSMQHPEHQLRTCQRCHYQWMESIPTEPAEPLPQVLKTQAELDQMPTITCKCGRTIYLQMRPTEEDIANLRLKECVERFPESNSDAYDPRCCRFPKSCSPYGTIEAVEAGNLTFEDLEDRSG